jgi:PAS domain S-box-containing protein
MNKILVVEDSKGIRDEICDILRFEGFEVISSEDGEKGLEQAKKELPNLILSDILMPKLNGYQFLEELQKLPATKSIPFIFLSGKAQLLDLRKGMNLGAEDYLVKPFITDELIKVVKGKLKKHQLVQDNIDKLVDENEFLLKEAGRMAKIGYWIYDKKTDEVKWSKAIHEIFGSDPKYGRPELDVILNCFNEESRQKTIKTAYEINMNGVSYDVELQITNLKNQNIWVQDIGEPLYNDKNEIIGARGVMRDITKLKNDQEELRQAKEEVEKSLKKVQLSEFLLKEGSVMAKFGVYEINTKKDSKYFSDEMYRIFNLQLDQEDAFEAIRKAFKKQSRILLITYVQECMEKGIPFDTELEIELLEHPTKWIRILGKPIYDENNEITGRRGIIQDVTNVKISQFELELSNKMIQEALELLEKSEYSKKEASKVAKIGYWEYNNVTDTVTWSEYIYHIFGLNAKKTPRPLQETVKIFDKESQNKIIQATLDLNMNGASYNLELKFINLNKKEVWVRSVAQPVYNEQNEIVGRRGVLQNITASKKAQLDLELSKQEIQQNLALLEKAKFSMEEASKMAKIGYWEYDILKDTYILSEYIYEEYELDPKEKIPTRTEIYDKELLEKLTEATLGITSKGINYDLELKFVNKKNEEVWIRSVGQPKFNEQNEIIGSKGVLQNITASKKAQFALELSKQEVENTLEIVKENEYSLKQAGRLAKIGYWSYDKQTDAIFWSDAVHEIYGTDPKNGVPEIDVVLSFFEEESRKKLVHATIMLATKGVPFDIVLQINNSNNEERWMRNIGEPLYNDKNEIIGRRGVSQDITEQKIKQNELDFKSVKLHDLNNALNQAQKLSNIGSWHWDMTADHAEWSDEMYSIYGVAKGDFYPSNENVTKTVLPQDLYKLECGISCLLEGETVAPFEFRIMRPSGEIRTLYIMALEKKSQQRIFGVTMDITERKKIEEENFRVKDSYRRLFNNATVSIWNEDLSLVFKQIEELRNGNIPNIKRYLEQHPDILFSLMGKVKVNDVNSATLKLFKAKSSQEFLGNIQDTFGEGANLVFVNLIEAIWNNDKTFTSEVNYKTLKGDEFAAIFSISIPQTAVEQKIVAVSIQSIQSIKDAESAKKESLHKLDEAQELAHVGSWFVNTVTQVTEWSDETFEIWGFDRKKGVPDFESLSNRVDTDDQELFISTFDEAFNLGIPYDIEYRVYLPNDQQKILRTICKPEFGNNSEVVGLEGITQDITLQKQAMDKIKKAEEMYRILTDHSNDLICLQEPDSTFKYISPSIKNLLGYEQSDFLGKTVFSIVHKDDISSLKEAMKKKVFSGEVIEAYTFRIRHKEGHFVWLEFLLSPVYVAHKISYFVTSARDVTEWMLAKQEIEEYQTSLQKLTTEITLIEEKQKKEIASNIHDHLSQSLVISKMRINELKKNPQLKLIDEDLKFIEMHISEALENSRKITYELSPPVLYQLGIVDALNWLLDDVEVTHKIACLVNSNVTNIKLSDIKAILLYRSIQEVITNSIKYANASLITLNIDKNNLGVDIFITDNGVGFDTSALKNLRNHSGSGFGLFTVQERIRNIQGKFTIASEINVGTSVKIFIPLTL